VLRWIVATIVAPTLFLSTQQAPDAAMRREIETPVQTTTLVLATDEIPDAFMRVVDVTGRTTESLIGWTSNRRVCDLNCR
jgi:hypothetical protein